MLIYQSSIIFDRLLIFISEGIGQSPNKPMCFPDGNDTSYSIHFITGHFRVVFMFYTQECGKLPVTVPVYICITERGVKLSRVFV